MARPPKPIITRERAAQAALAEIDARGLHGFSLSHVADRLGVKAPSLYHHFGGKDELLAETARLLLLEGRLPKAVAGLDWREEIVRISFASWCAILKHPHAAGLLLRFFPRRVLTGAYERWAHIFALNGVPLEWRLVVLEGAEKLTFGSALFGAAAVVTETELFPLQDPGRYPFLSEAASAHRLDDEETFLTTLRAFLYGVPLDRTPAEIAFAKPNGI
jgi:AcrR family transcriptional regulator